MSRSSTRRAQTQPLAAIAAVFAVGVGLSLYAGVLGTTLLPTRRAVAAPTLHRVVESVSEEGAVRPTRLRAGLAVRPEGYRLHVTVETGDRRWDAGPTPPRDARTDARFVSVRLGPGTVRTGSLRIEVWT